MDRVAKPIQHIGDFGQENSMEESYNQEA